MENANLLAPAVPDPESKPAAGLESPARVAPPQARLKPINRQQSVLRPVEVERLVEEDHPVRAIWELVGRLLPDAFYVGIKAVEGRMHTTDLHATLLALMGLDHEKLTYRYAGREFRLTDVAGNVVREIFA